MSGAPVEEFLRAVKSSALRAGEQLSNWAQALVRPWEGHGDGAQPSIKPRQKEGQRKGEPVRGFLRGFGGPLTGILPPRPGPKPKLREARVADRPLVVQDVQDAREARILDAEAKGAEMSPQLAVSAPSYGVGGGLALDLREAEPEVCGLKGSTGVNSAVPPRSPVQLTAAIPLYRSIQGMRSLKRNLAALPGLFCTRLLLRC